MGVVMNNEILQFYFTDNQLAVMMGITLGGLRNKIYRTNTSELPECTNVNSRTRLWLKSTVRDHLLKEYKGNVGAVDVLIAKGELASPGSSFEPRKPRDPATSAS